ncbi:DNA ligase [Paenibacillus glacialis]|nr:DNA ligase [Paenibacillus glacialis]
MSPILQSTLPVGEEWIYQLKWDGYRVIAKVEDKKVNLYSKKMLSLNTVFPELIEALSVLNGNYILDGEAILLDKSTGKPSFQQLQKRGRMRDTKLIKSAADREPVSYIVFDVLQCGEQNVRKLPFVERNQRLKSLAKDWKHPLYTTDVFNDGEVLWNWVVDQQLEGVVAKKSSSPYREGKHHHDWIKCKTSVQMEVDIVGVLMKEGVVSSLAMSKEGEYFGRISSGLNHSLKQQLALLPTTAKPQDYFDAMPEGLRRTTIHWLNNSLKAAVTGLEVTTAGQLRHPKLISIEGISNS